MMTGFNRWTWHWHEFFCGFLMILFCLALPLAGEGAEDLEEVRVGYIYDGAYFYKDADGQYRGYEAEYLYTLAQEAGWKLRFTDYSDSASSMAALYRDEVDLLMGMGKTTEREQTYLFSDKKMVTSYMTLMVRPDDQRYAYGDIPSFEGMVTAVRRGSDALLDIYGQWCRAHDLHVQLLYFDDNSEALQALLDGRADSMVIGGAYALDKTRAVAQFSPADSYFMVSPKRPDLKKSLDGAMEKVLTQNLLYELTLYNKYFGRTQGDLPLFTPEERQFIADSAVIRVAVPVNDPPYSFEDGNGAIQGAVVEYYQRLGVLSGLHFTFVSYPTMQEALQAVQDGQADVLYMYHNDIFDAQEHKLSLTVPYADMDMVQIAHKGASEVRRITVSRRDEAVARMLLGTEAERGLVVRPTAEECFFALKTGQADAMICDMQEAKWFLNQDRISGYTMASLPGSSWKGTSAMAQDQHLLRAVLNKTIIASGRSFQEILTSQSLRQGQGLTGFLDRIPVAWAVTAAAASIAMLILVLAALWILLRRRRTEQRLAAVRLENERRAGEVLVMTKANEAKFRFFSNISHDMRTPLNGIIGFTDLALRPENGEKIGEFLKKIKISGHLLLDLVNDTLTMSRLDNGKLNLSVRPVRLFTLLDDITVPVQMAAARTGVRFELDRSDAGNEVILADSLNVEKIFLNLLGNAMKFTAPGKTVRFIVRTAGVADQRLRLMGIVEDEGIGMSPEFLPHLFEPFAQERQASPDGTPGTGLGLAIVHQLVELMEGKITVESTVGKGTAFTVELPFSLTEELPAGEKSASDQSGTGSLAGKRILVCEDNQLNTEIACWQLDNEGMIPDCASDGKQGLEKFAASAPGYYAAILMDLRMPVMDGLAATEAIRRLDRPDAASVPIIAMSGDAFSEDVQRCLQHGFSDHVAKPVDAKKLYAVLASLIKH